MKVFWYRVSFVCLVVASLATIEFSGDCRTLTYGESLNIVGGFPPPTPAPVVVGEVETFNDRCCDVDPQCSASNAPCSAHPKAACPNQTSWELHSAPNKKFCYDFGVLTAGKTCKETYGNPKAYCGESYSCIYEMEVAICMNTGAVDRYYTPDKCEDNCPFN